MEQERLTIIIDLRIRWSDGHGGIFSFLSTLAQALDSLEDGNERYIGVTFPEEVERFRGLLPNRFEIVCEDLEENRSEQTSSKGDAVEKTPRVVERLRGFICRLIGESEFERNALSFCIKNSIRISALESNGAAGCERSNGFWENLGGDVVHFFLQAKFVQTKMPSVYNPHDLQHIHWPENFEVQERINRDSLYREACRSANEIVVASQWVARDLERNYQMSDTKVHVIPWAPPIQGDVRARVSEAKKFLAALGIEGEFCLYPAMTWQHKNHLRLLEGISRARENGTYISLVCTGKKQEHYPAIEERLKELGLEEQVVFPGLVDDEILLGLYGLTKFVVVPTLFEAASGPVYEAWGAGVPVACSNVTSLPAQVDGAALLFDPLSVEEIREALETLWVDEGARRDLVSKGERRLKDFSWENTAKMYRAVYRKASRRVLNDEERRGFEVEKGF